VEDTFIVRIWPTSFPETGANDADSSRSNFWRLSVGAGGGAQSPARNVSAMPSIQNEPPEPRGVGTVFPG
jgi:hypothetical protein